MPSLHPIPQMVRGSQENHQGPAPDQSQMGKIRPVGHEEAHKALFQRVGADAAISCLPRPLGMLPHHICIQHSDVVGPHHHSKEGHRRVSRGMNLSSLPLSFYIVG
jgi:hypothetical protein